MSLRVHHLNCGTLCPHGGKLIGTPGGWLSPGKMVCHCLLVETRAGLVLVDTGMGTGDIDNPAQLGRPFVALTRPRLEHQETALAQIRVLGYSAADVRHIVVTHLDLDHAGGAPACLRSQRAGCCHQLRRRSRPARGLRDGGGAHDPRRPCIRTDSAEPPPLRPSLPACLHAALRPHGAALPRHSPHHGISGVNLHGMPRGGDREHA